MEETLQFLIMIDGDCSDLGLISLIGTTFPEAIRIKSHSCKLQGNLIEIWKNENADTILAQRNKNGFLYYKCRLEATPLAVDISDTNQIELARELKSCFEAAGLKAVVCANFEDRV